VEVFGEFLLGGYLFGGGMFCFGEVEGERLG
jgi:hypothetical protein